MSDLVFSSQVGDEYGGKSNAGGGLDIRIKIELDVDEQENARWLQAFAMFGEK